VSRYIDEHRGRFDVEPICRVLDVSASAYYHRASSERSQRVIEDERLTCVIREVHEAKLLRLRLPADVEGASPRRRAGRA
jgi:hypothetical protein